MTFFGNQSSMSPRPTPKFIESIELENIGDQVHRVKNFRSLLTIENQGNGIYLYYSKFNETDSISDYETDIKIAIRRSGEETPSNLMYVKTIIVKDIAYHFFSNYNFDH